MLEVVEYTWYAGILEVVGFGWVYVVCWYARGYGVFVAQWRQLSRYNSLLRGYRSRHLNPKNYFYVIISQIGYKNLENCLKVKIRKKSVEKVEKTCFFGDFGF